VCRWPGLSIALALVPLPAFATLWVVPDDHPTIQEALDSPSLVAGDEIMVRAGIYDENLVVRENVRIFSESGPAATLIRGSAPDPVPVTFDDPAVVYTAFAQRVHLEGFTIENVWGPALIGGWLSPVVAEVGIFITNGAKPGLKDLWIRHNEDHGIYSECGAGSWNRLWIHDNGNPSVDGGGAYLGGTGTFALLNDLLFENNIADNGGGLYATNLGCHLSLIGRGTEWRYNVASDGNGDGRSHGGALHLSSPTPSSAVFSDMHSDFMHDNVADGHGGGTYSLGVSLEFELGWLVDNHAGLNGGGVAMESTPDLNKRLFLYAMDLRGNTAAGEGGGVAVHEATLNLDDATVIEDNRALGGRGGGIWGWDLSPYDWPLLNATIRNNQAAAEGGGMALIVRNVDVDDLDITDNTAGGHGGGVWFGRESVGTWNGGLVTRNRSGGDGGGLYAGPAVNLRVSEVDLLGNVADLDGGGLSAEAPVRLELSDLAISGNEALSLGGGVKIVGGVLHGERLDLVGNALVALGGGRRGAGLYARGATTVEVVDSLLQDHHADEGGALYAWGGRLELSDNRLLENSSVGAGGGAWMGTFDLNGLVLRSNLIGGNSAFQGAGGGAHLTAMAGGEVLGNVFVENHAGTLGGNLFAAGSLRVVHTDLVCGSAARGGGLWLNDATVELRNSIVAWSTHGHGAEAAQAGPVVEYNAWYDNQPLDWLNLVPGAGNLSTDPQWLGVSCDGDFQNDRLRLSPGSPLIDAGDPAATWLDPDGSRADIGSTGGPLGCDMDSDGDGDPACSDCDDGDPTRNTTDADGDGITSCAGDCDDSPLTGGARSPLHPETCDGIDNDCDPLTSIPGEAIDVDGDGGPSCSDCDDADPTRFPDNEEICDLIDNDCDGLLPFLEVDADGDGYTWCGPWQGTDPSILGGGDCVDSNAGIHPGATELCDGRDNDCDFMVDGSEYTDADQDGSLACADCADDDPSNQPGGVELCDGHDNDCNGLADFTGPDGDELDADGDAWGLCAGDCDDDAADRNPGQVELCDGVDNNCDGTVDESFDLDGDGFFPCVDDCDDLDPLRYPGSPELCDGIDNDCDPLTEAPGTEADLDGDGAVACADCDDSDAARAFPPVGVELCDGIDNDCDGVIPDGPGIGEIDGDGDGQAECAGDCDDADPSILGGGPELCDGRDSDCDGILTEHERDVDGDGARGCDGDCNNVNPTVCPGCPEVCDGVDNDCDPTTEFGGPGGERDADLDGQPLCAGDCDDGHPAVGTGFPELCNGLDDDCDAVVPILERDSDGDGLAECAGDCDDNNAARGLGFPEQCDGLDDDCDGALDPSEQDLDGDTWIPCAGDCDDGDAAVHPGVPGESACGDGADNDCDGLADCSDPDCSAAAGCSNCADLDGDGSPVDLGGCPDGPPWDCNDMPATGGFMYPGNLELVCDGLDNDCDPATLDDPDDDGDSVSLCQGDCDDEDPAVRPGLSELPCNGLDDDCDPGTPDDADSDGDERGSCEDDCDDGDPTVYVGALELCDGLDNDCDSMVPTDEVDLDGDGWMPCDGDCDDDDPTIHPAQAEVCDNGVDDNCDRIVDVREDVDEDGFDSCVDCDDTDPQVHPGVPDEYCDGIDDDCDGEIDEGAPDVDADGFNECVDCDDVPPQGVDTFPGAPELCDGLDNDCDGELSEAEIDADADGFGICEGDCNDLPGEAGATVYPGAPELCDGVDNDCDDEIDEGACEEEPADCDCRHGSGPRPSQLILWLMLPWILRSRRCGAG
jgi:hypothetical protein